MKSIVLASASPRRKQLMEQAGYRFSVAVSDVEESGFEAEGLDSSEFAKRLAMAKAKAIAVKYTDSIVIGADTVVDFQGRIIGKPVNKKEAEEITRKLFSCPHKVITAIAIVRLSDGIEIVDSDTTWVYPRELTEEQIADHIKSDNWQGRAGAYGIKEKGEEFVERIEGSFTNVCGMPMELLEKLMADL
jgi:septum formation protein